MLLYRDQKSSTIPLTDVHMSACRMSCSKDKRNKNETNKYFVAKLIVARQAAQAVMGWSSIRKSHKMIASSKIAELIMILEEIIEIKVEQERVRD